MAETFTLAGTLGDLTGDFAGYGITGVYLNSTEKSLLDTDTGDLRVASGKAMVLDRGTGAASLDDIASSTDPAWSPGGQQYQLEVHYLHHLNGTERVWKSQWFPMDANKTFADLEMGPPTVVNSEVYESLLTARDEALAARDETVEISGIDDVGGAIDTLMPAKITNPAGPVGLALSTTIADTTADSIAGTPGSGLTPQQAVDARVLDFGDDRYSLIGATLQQAPGKNLFDKDAAFGPDKYWSFNSSTPGNLAGFSASPKIPVTASTTYTISNPRHVAFFDSGGTIMATGTYLSNATEAPLTFTTPAGAAFVGYTVTTSKINESQMELGNAATAYEPHGVQVQHLLAGGERLDTALTRLAEAAAAVRRAGGVTVYKTGNNMLVRSMWDSTRDLTMPVCLSRAIAAGGEAMVTLSLSTADSAVRHIPSATKDSELWPRPTTLPGTDIHSTFDDNAPINNGTSYVGGNHGWQHATTVTMTAHGKTNADRGSTWTDGARTYTLFKIVDANTLLFANDYTVTSGRVTGSLTVPSGSLTHVAGATNTAAVTVSGGKVLGDLHPVTHSRTAEARLDGQPLVDGVTSGRALTITETYLIASFKGIVDWSRANIGSDPFANLAAMTQYARVSNTYRFTSSQVIVTQTVTALEATTLTMQVTQATQITIPVGGSRKQTMAGVNTVAGVDFRTLADLASMTGDANIALANRADANTPPQRAILWACDSGGTKQWGLAVGLLPVMDGKFATRKANGADTVGWYISSSVKKNYPRLATGKVMAIGESLTGMAFRRYLPPTAPPELLVSDGARLWVMVDRTDAAIDQIAKAPEAVGRRLTTVGATTLTVAAPYVSGEGVTYTNTAPGYLLAEAAVDTTV